MPLHRSRWRGTEFFLLRTNCKLLHARVRQKEPVQFPDNEFEELSQMCHKIDLYVDGGTQM